MKSHTKKRVEKKAGVAKNVRRYGKKLSDAEIKKLQKSQQRSLKALIKKVEELLLLTDPKNALRIVDLIKDAGVFDLFVALGKSTKLLNHLKKGKK